MINVENHGLVPSGCVLCNLVETSRPGLAGY